MNPFDFVNAVCYSKQNLIKDADNAELAEKLYQPFITNRSLSYHLDAILHANEINQNGHLDNRLQFEYYLSTLRPVKRYSKWAKKSIDQDLDAVKQYYGYSNEKAYAALRILSAEQLELIKQKLQQGGEFKHGAKKK